MSTQTVEELDVDLTAEVFCAILYSEKCPRHGEWVGRLGCGCCSPPTCTQHKQEFMEWLINSLHPKTVLVCDNGHCSELSEIIWRKL